MSLDALYMPRPAGREARVERLMGPWEESATLTPSQLAQRRWAREKQIGMSKAPNRVKR